MATNKVAQVSQAKQIATALKAAAKLITQKDRQVNKLTTQLERAHERLAAAKEAKAAAKTVRQPRAAKAEKVAKAPRARRVADEDDEQPVKTKRGPKAGAEKVTKVVAKKTKVAKEVGAKRGPKAGAGKEPIKGKVAKQAKPVKKAKAGNDDFLLP